MSAQYRKYRENTHLKKTATLFYTTVEANNIEEKRWKQTGNKVKGQ